MEVKLSPDLEDKLARAAGRRSVSAEVLIREAIERAVDYDDWFVREVEKGLAQIDAGQVLTYEAVGGRLEQKLAEHQRRCGFPLWRASFRLKGKEALRLRFMRRGSSGAVTANQ